MIDTQRIPFLIGALGALLAAVVVGEVVALAYVEGGDFALLGVSVFTTAPFILACLYAGRWLHRSGIDPARYARVGGWVLGGMLAFLALNVLTILLMLPMNVFFLVGWLRWAAALGAGAGVVIGALEARAIQRAVLAERARIRADEAETREELLKYLHNLLRHKVRNAVNAIDGHAALMTEDAETDDRYYEAISRQTSELSQIVREVRTFLEASGAEDSFESVDLCCLLRTELDELGDRLEVVELDIECQEGVLVRGDDLMPRAFRNLLVNSTITDPDDVSRIHVSIATTDRSAFVEIEDDGETVRDFEDGDLLELNQGGTPEQGLGLPLGRILIERYGGTVTVGKTGVEGTTMTVELPLADPTAPASAHQPATATTDGGPRL